MTLPSTRDLGDGTGRVLMAAGVAAALDRALAGESEALPLLAGRGSDEPCRPVPAVGEATA
eukprot:3594-Hanusia_phi.AAC.2